MGGVSRGCANRFDPLQGRAGTIPSVATLQSVTYTFPTQWSPHVPLARGTVQGNYTVTFAFTEGDFDTSDDTLVVNVIVTEEFKDIIVPGDQDPRDGLLDVASDGDGAVLNTNVTYPRAARHGASTTTSTFAAGVTPT